MPIHFGGIEPFKNPHGYATAGRFIQTRLKQKPVFIRRSLADATSPEINCGSNTRLYSTTAILYGIQFDHPGRYLSFCHGGEHGTGTVRSVVWRLGSYSLLEWLWL